MRMKIGGVKMKCDFDYCIYNKEFNCTLSEIQLNSLGMCDKRVMVTIPNETLKALKENLLKGMESR
jgi:hypothetical protein